MTNVDDYRAGLKRVAAVFASYAIVEGVMFAYCVANRINFASSLGTLALFAAFFLWRGSLRAAAIVRWGTLFVAALVAPSLVLWPLVFPPDLLLAACRHRTLPTFLIGGYLGVTFAICLWAAQETGRKSVAAARSAAGRKPIDRRYPLACGAALGLGGWMLIIAILNGATAIEVERQAAEQFGADYRYRTIGLGGLTLLDDSAAFATVAMWNDRELKTREGVWYLR